MPDPTVILSSDFPYREKLCYFFRIEYNGVTSDIREPGKWDSVGITGERDKDWHGWNYQYSDGEVQLDFDDLAGKQILEQAYAEGGNDAAANFYYGFNETFYLFTGKFNFNTYKRENGRVNIAVERKDFNDLLQSRFDTKVSMAALDTLDGIPLTPPASFSLALHAKEIVKKYERFYEPVIPFAPESYTLAATLGKSNLYYRFNTTEPKISEIETVTEMPLGISTLDPIANELYNWRLKFGGVITFSLDAYWSITVNITLGSGAYSFTPKMIIRRGGVNVLDVVIGTVMSGPTIPALLTVSGNINYDLLNFVCLPEDNIFIYIHLIAVNRAISSTFTCNTMNFVLNMLETTPASTAKAWMLFDAVNHGIKVVTNNTSYLKSTLLNTLPTAGQFSEYAVTNGFQIRKFEDRPLLITLKQMFSSLRANAAIGFGFEYVGTVEVVRVEGLEYFYQNLEILIIEEVEKYSEEVETSLIFNEVEIGYNKYKEDGYNTLDEFNTRHEYLTPIKTHKNKLVLKSDFITSGYSIEDTRRQQYNDTPTNSYANDDECFLISLNGVIPEKNEAFAEVNNLISPTTAYNLRLSPKRMLQNWAKWLGSLFYKDGTEIVKNTFVDKNGDLSTRFLGTEPNPMGDTQKVLVIEKGNLTVAQLGSFIFTPEKVTVRCKLLPDAVLLINESLKGIGLKAYGYIRIKKNSLEYQNIWLNKITYNFYTEKATLEGIKKWS